MHLLKRKMYEPIEETESMESVVQCLDSKYAARAEGKVVDSESSDDSSLN